MLKNDYLVAKIGVDTAENYPEGVMKKAFRVAKTAQVYLINLWRTHP